LWPSCNRFHHWKLRFRELRRRTPIFFSQTFCRYGRWQKGSLATEEVAKETALQHEPCNA
jgi:hypothetical protein